MDSCCFGSLTKFTFSIIALVLLLSCFSFTSTEALQPYVPKGNNITIAWNVISWTPDGYVAGVTIYNSQSHPHASGQIWTMRWLWAGKEIIWSISGGQSMYQGDCSRFKGNIPISCKKNPSILVHDKAEEALASFQISVGDAGTTNKTVELPKNFTLKASHHGYYSCGPARIVRPAKLISPDRRRITLAMMTWNVTCTSTHNAGQRKLVEVTSTDEYNDVFSASESAEPTSRINGE